MNREHVRNMICFSFSLFIAFLLLYSINACASTETDRLPNIVLELITTMPNPDKSTVETELSKITREKLGCTVSIMEVNTSEHLSAVQQFSATHHADIILSGFTTPLSELKSWNLIRDISDILKETPGLEEKCGRLLDACRIGGGIYCIPGNLYPATQEYLFIRSDIDVPEITDRSYESITEVFRYIRDGGFSGFPTTGGNGFRLIYYPDTLDAFGDPLNYVFGVMKSDSDDYQIFNLYETDDFREYCDTAAKWYEEGYLEKNSLLTDSTLARSSQDGHIAAFIRSCNYNSSFTLKIQGQYTFNSIPLDQIRITTDAVADQGLAVTALSKHPELCIKLIELIYTDPEVMNLLNYGIEGLHYRKKNNPSSAGNIPEEDSGNAGREVQQLIERIPKSDGSYGYGNFVFFIGDAALAYCSAPADESYYDQLQTFGIKEAEVSPSFGYVFDPQSVSAEVNQVKEVIVLYRPGLVCGCVDVEKLLPMFISELKRAGIDRIIAENQRQFDAWRKKG